MLTMLVNDMAACAWPACEGNDYLTFVTQTIHG